MGAAAPDSAKWPSPAKVARAKVQSSAVGVVIYRLLGKITWLGAQFT